MSALVLAQETAPSGFATFFPLLLIAGIFLLMILPQRRARKAQQELQSSIEIGQRVRTAGGIHGTVTALDEATAIIEVESGTLRIERRAIVARLDD